MSEGVQWALGIGALIVSARAVWLLVRRRRVDNPQFYLMAGVEAGLVGAAVAAFVGLGTTDRDIPAGLLVSYWITTLVVLPAGLLWGISDKTRWGTGVVAVSGVTVAALIVRLWQIWTTGV